MVFFIFILLLSKTLILHFVQWKCHPVRPRTTWVCTWVIVCFTEHKQWGTDLGWAASTSQLQRYKLEYCQKHSIEWNTVDPKMKCWPRSVMCSWWQINILYFIYFLWNHSVRHCYLWTKSSKVTCWLKSISEVGRLDCATISNRTDS